MNVECKMKNYGGREEKRAETLKSAPVKYAAHFTG
jgi:hypothetical protein